MRSLFLFLLFYVVYGNHQLYLEFSKSKKEKQIFHPSIPTYSFFFLPYTLGILSKRFLVSNRFKKPPKAFFVCYSIWWEESAKWSIDALISFHTLFNNLPEIQINSKIKFPNIKGIFTLLLAKLFGFHLSQLQLKRRLFPHILWQIIFDTHIRYPDV